MSVRDALRGRRTKAAIALLAAKPAAFSASLFAGAQSAGATAPTCHTGRPSHYFDGFASNISSYAVSGVQAGLTNGDPAVCSTDVPADAGWAQATSSAWVSVLGSGSQILQVGYIKNESWTTGSRYFVAWSDGVSAPNPHLGATIPDASDKTAYHKYTAYRQSNGTWRFNIDDAYINQVSQSTLGWGDGTQAGWDGEVNYTESHMPGEVSYKVAYGYMQKLYNGTWFDENMSTGGLTNSDFLYGGQTVGTSSSQWIWDTRTS